MAEDDKSNDKSPKGEEPPIAEPVSSKPVVRQPPPAPAPAPQYYQKPPFQPADFVSNKMLFIAILIGIVLILVGGIVLSIAPTIGAWDDTGEDIAKAAESQVNTNAVGEILFNLGIFFIVLFLLFAGCFRDDIHNIARLGMFIAVGVLLLVFIT